MRLILNVVAIMGLVGCDRGNSVADQIPVAIDKPISEAKIAQTSTRDAPIYEGRYFLIENEGVFRPCGRDERYWVSALYWVRESLDEAVQSITAGENQPIYVRFLGDELDKVDGLPPTFDGAVRIREVLAKSTTVLARCD